jgi:hypothetical protein
MKEEESATRNVLSSFNQALASWVCKQNVQPLSRWLARELDREGRVARLAIADWQECLVNLLEAKGLGQAWPACWDEPLSRLNRAVLRYSRPDGSPVTSFEPLNNRRESAALWRGTSNPRTGAALPSANGRGASLENGEPHDDARPDWEGSHRVLGALGSAGLAAGDFLIVDHRELGVPCRFELFGGGRSWLGPGWAVDGHAIATSIPKPGSWISSPAADLAEWSYSCSGNRIIQSAVLLKTRRMALLGITLEARSSSRTESIVRVSLPHAALAATAKDHRGITISEPGKTGSAQVLPIGLPSLPYATERGAFCAERDGLVLQQTTGGRRCWLPLVVSWDPRRNRKSVNWRVLTVSEKSRAIGADRACAVRVSWGRDETYVIYRSLGPTALRTFLGYQTSARFLWGLFTPDGTVTPILKLE